MSLAETAVLAVDLKLTGATAFKSGVAEADAAALSLGKTATSTGNILGGTASKFSLVKQAVGGTATALEGMASHLKGVVTGPLGLLGLGAGLFTIGGLLKAGTEEASSFGLEVAKLQALTGGSVETVSALASALDHFGISGDAAVKTVGMITKNLSAIQHSKGGLEGFAKEFGLNLTDAKGNLVSVNEEILRTADYFNNKTIPSTDKALALQKLYSRSWQTLIPFLAAGRVGIQEAEQAAQDLGLTLTAQNLGDLKRYRENFLTLGDATKGLQLQLGLVLIPLLSDLAKSFTSFLREGGTTKIVAFFKDLVQNAKDFGRVITGTIIPTITGLASSAKSFWDSIPAPLRDLIFKGVVADRTIHFLFGVSPINLAKNLIGDVLGPVLNHFAERGSSPANPVFVSAIGGGLPGGLPNVLGSGGGLLAAAGGVAGIVAIASIVIPLAALAIYAGSQPNPHPGEDKPGIYSPKGGRAAVSPYQSGMVGGMSPDDRQAASDAMQAHAAGILTEAAIKDKDSSITLLSAAKAIKDAAGVFRQKTEDAYKFAEGKLGTPGSTVQRKGSLDFGKTWVDVITRDFLQSDSTTYRSTANLQATIAKLERAQVHATGASAKDIGKDLSILKGELAKRLAATKKAIDDKKWSVSVTVPVQTYFNGRLLLASLSQYSSVRGSHGLVPLD